MANIKRLGACGKLLIAGPFKHPSDAPDQGPLAGIFLFDVATQEEAEALMRICCSNVARHVAAALAALEGGNPVRAATLLRLLLS